MLPSPVSSCLELEQLVDLSIDRKLSVIFAFIGQMTDWKRGVEGEGYDVQQRSNGRSQTGDVAVM